MNPEFNLSQIPPSPVRGEGEGGIETAANKIKTLSIVLGGALIFKAVGLGFYALIGSAFSGDSRFSSILLWISLGLILGGLLAIALGIGKARQMRARSLGESISSAHESRRFRHSVVTAAVFSVIAMIALYTYRDFTSEFPRLSNSTFEVTSRAASFAASGVFYIALLVFLILVLYLATRNPRMTTIKRMGRTIIICVLVLVSIFSIQVVVSGQIPTSENIEIGRNRSQQLEALFPSRIGSFYRMKEGYVEGNESYYTTYVSRDTGKKVNAAMYVFNDKVTDMDIGRTEDRKRCSVRNATGKEVGEVYDQGEIYPVTLAFNQPVYLSTFRVFDTPIETHTWLSVCWPFENTIMVIGTQSDYFQDTSSALTNELREFINEMLARNPSAIEDFSITFDEYLQMRRQQ
jgi:hypothetical protein